MRDISLGMGRQKGEGGTGCERGLELRAWSNGT